MFLIRKAHQFPPEGFFIFVLFLFVNNWRLLPGPQEINQITNKAGRIQNFSVVEKQISNYRKSFWLQLLITKMKYSEPKR